MPKWAVTCISKAATYVCRGKNLESVLRCRRLREREKFTCSDIYREDLEWLK